MKWIVEKQHHYPDRYDDDGQVWYYVVPKNRFVRSLIKIGFYMPVLFFGYFEHFLDLKKAKQCALLKSSGKWGKEEVVKLIDPK